MSFIVYFDEDSQKKELVRLARDAGLVVTFPNEQNTCGWTDEEQLVFAAARGWILFSFNVIDFRRLHTRWKLDGRSHSGIIVAEQSVGTFREKALALASLVNGHSADQMQNHLMELKI